MPIGLGISVGVAASGVRAVPSQFGASDWSVADPVTGGDITVTISALPAAGTAAITDIEYRIDGGSWVSLGTATTGSTNVAGLVNFTQVAVAIRAVNTVGAGVTSATKNVTPTTPVPSYIGTGGAAFNTANVTLTPHASTTTDDIILVGVLTQNTVCPTPTNFAIVANSPQGTGTANNIASARLSLFWKRAGASEGDITITDSGDMQYARSWTFRGCPTSGNPWDVTAGDTASATASVVCPSVTTTVDGCLVIAICAHGIDADGAQLSVGFANSNLVSLTGIGDGSTITGNGGGIAAVRGVKQLAGPTGTTTATLSASTEQGRMTIALKAA
jgi:hypothetical protein